MAQLVEHFVVVFQNTPNRHPIDASALHRYLCNIICNKSFTQSIQLFGQNTCLELDFLTIFFVNTHKYIIFVNIKTTDISHRLGI